MAHKPLFATIYIGLFQYYRVGMDPITPCYVVVSDPISCVYSDDSDVDSI